MIEWGLTIYGHPARLPRSADNLLPGNRGTVMAGLTLPASTNRLPSFEAMMGRSDYWCGSVYEVWRYMRQRFIPCYSNVDGVRDIIKQFGTQVGRLPFASPQFSHLGCTLWFIRRSRLLCRDEHGFPLAGMDLNVTGVSSRFCSGDPHAGRDPDDMR